VIGFCARVSETGKVGGLLPLRQRHNPPVGSCKSVFPLPGRGGEWQDPRFRPRGENTLGGKARPDLYLATLAALSWAQEKRGHGKTTGCLPDAWSNGYTNRLKFEERALIRFGAFRITEIEGLRGHSFENTETGSESVLNRSCGRPTLGSHESAGSIGGDIGRSLPFSAAAFGSA